MGADRVYLTPNELSDLTAFLGVRRPFDRSFRGEGETAETSGDPQRGRELVVDKGCLGCHALAGAGGPGAGSFDRVRRLADSPWNVLAAMWNHALLMHAEGVIQQRPWPRLSGAELADLVAFLRAGRPRP
jgi:hypothetical protein